VIDIGFLLDESNSITSADKLRMKTFIAKLVIRLGYGFNRTHLAYMPYSTLPYKFGDQHQFFNFEIPLSMQTLDAQDREDYIVGHIRDEDDYGFLQEDADYMKLFPPGPYQKGQSYMDRALTAANKVLFTKERGMRENVKQVLVVISDGQNTNMESLMKASQEINKRADVQITVMAVAVGEISQKNLENLQIAASDDSYIFKASNFNTVLSVLENVTRLACAKDEAKWGGWMAWRECSVTCGDGTKSRNRVCKGGQPGEGLCIGKEVEQMPCNLGPCPATDPTIKQTPAPGTAYHCYHVIDIVFVVDNSASITAQWQNVKNFLKGLVSRFTLGPENSYVGIISYSDEAREYIPLGSEVSQDDLDLSLNIQNMVQVGGGTRIDKALRFTYDAISRGKTGEGHNRPNVPDVVVLFTDGVSDPGSEDMKEASKPLRDYGAHILGVGFGENANEQELKRIATVEKGVFIMEDYDKIATYIDHLAKGICDTSEVATVEKARKLS